LPVDVQRRVGYREQFGRLRQFADQIQHRTVAESSSVSKRKAGHGAQMAFKLAGYSALDAPMAGIVDTRGHFVCKQAATQFKQFDREDAHVIKGLKDAARGILRFMLQGWHQVRSRGERQAQNSAPMMIFDEGIERSLAA